MKKLGIVIIVFALSFLPILTSAKNKWVAPNAELAKPTGTYEFVKRDTANLMLDFYKPTEGSVTEVNGKVKPAIVFAFGGGFVSGHRDKEHYQQWIKLLNDNGFAVFSIDYRLGLKGAKMGGIKTIGAVRHAINVGVEDMFSATCYIVEHASDFGIDPNNLVLAGSSAGAIIALQSEYELCNRTKLASVLPAGFKYSGVISFSGAIFSSHGRVKYADAPAPQLLLHGTDDRVVTYKQIKVFRLGLFGSSKIAKRLDKFGYSYEIVRYKDHTHDIADLMYYTFPEQLRFLEESVIKKTGRTVDIMMDDPAVPVDNTLRTLSDLYK